MNEFDSCQLIVVEARSILRHALTLYHPCWTVRPVDSIASAMQFALACPESTSESTRTVFALGGSSYWDVLEHGTRLRACLPEAKFIFVDDRVKPGCGAVADRLGIQGYVSLYDAPEHGIECTEKVFDDELYVSPRGETFLEIDPKRISLRSRKPLRDGLPCAFSDREWHCLRLLLSGREYGEIAKLLDLTDRSARNIKYRIMKKMGVRHFTDVLRTAHGWGLLDS